LADHRAILIASASVGEGHIRCAEAVREALLSADPSRRVEHVDVLDFATDWARRVYREAFLRVAARSRPLAYALYVGSDGEKPDDVRWGHLAERVAFRRFSRFVHAGRWQHCICTHPLPSQLMHREKRPRTHLVVTDWALHRFWVQPYVDNFFVASERMATTLRERLPRTRAHPTGIPIGARFGQHFDQAALRRDLGLDPRAPVVLVMGGGWGLGVPETVRAALAARVPGLAVLAVCGANVEAHRALADHPPDRLRVFGFLADVAPLIAAADLVISKPGGVTTSETLALGRPLLLTQGLPGHEDRNARELTVAGAARFADAADLAREIEIFFRDAGLRQRWTRASVMAGRPHAAAHIAAFFDGRAVVEERARRKQASVPVAAGGLRSS
jgi:processive 1,2-diacylglycerol beta-glucosyltransferase